MSVPAESSIERDFNRGHVKKPRAADNSNSNFSNAYTSTVARLAQDMPLLLHGSGDTYPINPDTAYLVASLTTTYIAQLVEAAMNAQEHMQSDLVAAQRDILPPPVFQTAKKRKQDYWDEPLPEPNVKGSTRKPLARMIPSDDDWVGVSGVNFYGNQPRSAYVHGALSAQSFVYAICHDARAYGRALHVQTSKRNTLLPLLADSVVMDVMRMEQSHRRNHKTTDDAADDDDEEDARQQQKPEWPTLDTMLPIHRDMFRTNSEDNK
jgi:hypothetical protein